MLQILATSQHLSDLLVTDPESYDLLRITEGQPVSLEQDILPKLIGRDLYGLPFKGYFVDIGVPADYMRLRSTPTQLLAAVNQGGIHDVLSR